MIKEIIESLTLYLGANANSLAFPELVVPITVQLKKFKKLISSGIYKKSIQSLLDLIVRHETYIAQSRSKIRDKSLRDPAKLFQQFSAILQGQSNESAPMAKEQAKIEKTRIDHVTRKMQTAAASQNNTTKW